MIQKVFAIRDDKAEAYMPPICFVTRGQAVRWFSDAMHSPDQEIAKHPEDYKLMYVGDFNVMNGLLLGADTGPQFVVSGLDVMSLERGGL